MNKIFKKVLCATLATATLAGGAIAFGGCTTNRPEVEMQISFNGKTYTLEYQLFRKLAPNTVEHFLVLAENGYYNGVCVHDYTSSKWYTGGYTYDAAKEETGGLVYKDYFSIVSAYENKDFVSVWKDSEKANPTYTLYGEFSANGMKMDKGDFLSQSFGSLSMVYEDKGDGEDWRHESKAEKISAVVNNHNTKGEAQVFAEALLAGKDMPISSMEGAKTVAVAAATVQSAKEDRAIIIQYPEV